MPFDNTNFETTENAIDRDLRILRAAREGISKPGGWCQGSFHEGDAHCAVGWIMHVTDNEPDTCMTDVLERAIFPMLPKYAHGSLMIFNDLAIRQATVTKFFDRAIARLEQEKARHP